jgi:hypothetical protein
MLNNFKIYPQLVLTLFFFDGFKLYERIRTKFSANYAKQTRFFLVFHPKTTIPQKNKPISNPTCRGVALSEAGYKPKIVRLKLLLILRILRL